MPAPFEFLLEILFDIFCGVFQVGDLIFDHLNVDVLSDKQGIFFHVYFHITELYVCGYLHARGDPIFWDASSGGLFLLCFVLFLLFFYLFSSHFE